MKLNKAINEVKRWNQAFGHLPEDDDEREAEWRYDDSVRGLAFDLIQEEVWELEDACADFYFTEDGSLPKENDVKTLDALVDIMVTVFGLACKAGLDELIEPAFKEVMRANWSKADADGNPVYYPDGKIAKSELYTPPNLRQFFDEEELS